MKTLKQIAEENSLAKETIRKRVKRLGLQLHRSGQTFYADEAQEAAILAAGTPADPTGEQLTIDELLKDPATHGTPTPDRSASQEPAAADPEEQPADPADTAQQPDTEPQRATDPGRQEEPAPGPDTAQSAPEQPQSSGQLAPFTEHLLKQIEIKDELIRSLSEQLQQVNEQNRELIRSLQFEQSRTKLLEAAAAEAAPTPSKDPEPAPVEPAPTDPEQPAELKKRRGWLYRLFFGE